VNEQRAGELARHEAYDQGYRLGAWETRNRLGHRFPMGLLIGMALGALIQPLVFFWKGVCW